MMNSISAMEIRDVQVQSGEHEVRFVTADVLESHFGKNIVREASTETKFLILACMFLEANDDDVISTDEAKVCQTY